MLVTMLLALLLASLLLVTLLWALQCFYLCLYVHVLFLCYLDKKPAKILKYSFLLLFVASLMFC